MSFLSLIFENEFKHGGVDQALMPLYSSYVKKGKITPYEIDIENIANETELGSCFKDASLSVRMTSALSPDHVDKMGIDSKVNPKNPSTYIRSHICNNLSWVKPMIFQGRTENFLKSVLSHRCPTHEGMSGSFMELECKEKKGFFVHQAGRFEGISEYVKKIAEQGGIIYPDRYEDKNSFINKATQIDYDLLNLYFQNYCVSSSG